MVPAQPCTLKSCVGPPDSPIDLTKVTATSVRSVFLDDRYPPGFERGRRCGANRIAAQQVVPRPKPIGEALRGGRVIQQVMHGVAVRERAATHNQRKARGLCVSP
jgi:hypothetical protein